MKKKIFSLLCLISLNVMLAQKLNVQGKHLISTQGDTVVLKGFNWGFWGLAQQGDAEAACEMGANVIRMPMRWFFGGGGNDQRDSTQPGNISPSGLAILDQQIQWCSSNHIWIILFGGSDRGAGDDVIRHYWNNPSLKQEFVDMWQFLADRYKNTPYMAAYELLSEPHPKNPTTNAQLRRFYKELADSVRKFDPNTSIMIGANDHYDINLMDSIYMTGIDAIPNLFYTFNFYLPTDYCKIEKRVAQSLPVVSYPSSYIDFDGNPVTLDQNYLNQELQKGVAFRNTYNVPIFINQVGARAACPNYLQYTSDVLDLFNTNKVGFAFWTWRTSRTDSLEHGLYYKHPITGLQAVKQGLYNVLDQKLGNINACLTTDLKAIEEPLTFNFYPNPSKGIIYVEHHDEDFITIRNGIGQFVYKTQLKKHEKTIDVSFLSDGMYFVTLNGITKKVLIHKE